MTQRLIQFLDAGVVHRANRDAAALLRRLTHPQRS
jgi:hypothetical protein